MANSNTIRIVNRAGYRVSMTTCPPLRGLLPLGTRVTSRMLGREKGIIIGYNPAVADSLYPTTRYPYIIVWEDGYFDHYGPSGFSVLPPEIADPPEPGQLFRT